MRIRYDSDADALYIRLVEGKIDDTDEVEEGIIIDYDAERNAMGVEVLDAAKRLRDEANAIELTKLIGAIALKAKSHS